MLTRRTSSIKLLLLLLTIHQSHTSEDGYLRYVKDGCFIKGEAMNCIKYKALKIAKKTIFGDNMYANDTIRANQMISFVPLDEETIKQLAVKEEAEVLAEEPRSIFSEWSQLTKYVTKLVKDFFKMKGVKVSLPEGARAIEDDDVDSTGGESRGRGRRKKLALIIPLMTLAAAVKAKLLLIPILLAVLLIKKLLLIAALLLPSLLNTLKHCKHRHSYSYFGGNDAADFSSDYGNSFSYSTGGGYTKDWGINRAYTMPKAHQRPTPAPVYITAPGAAA